MKTFFSLIMLMIVAMSAIASPPYTHNTLMADGTLGPAPDPLQTILIADNYSHTVNVSKNLWYGLDYNGTGTCIIRLMNTNVKASYVAEQVPASKTHSYLINTNTNFINYSGCQGGAAPANSIFHLM